MPTLDSIDRQLKIIRNLLDKSAKKETWVSVHVIKSLTTWQSGEQMRTARSNGLVKYDSKKNAYLLESVHPMFLKSKSN